MKKKMLISLVLILPILGCAVTRPNVLRKNNTIIHLNSNGTTNSIELVVLERVSLPAFVSWPANQLVERQRGSVGKTVTAGFAEAGQEGGSTNVLDSLRILLDVITRIRQ